jgi:leucyl-tRNA synthetase
MHKWLDRVYRLFTNNHISYSDHIDATLNQAYHRFIKQVSTNINQFNFNVAVSQMMIYINECYNHQILSRCHLENFLVVLSCFAPHLAEEL